MALYTIGDLHLSLGSDKPMDIFGDRWQNYVEKIQRGFSAVTENDTTVLCGDRYAAPAAGFTSWTTRAHTTKKC